MTNWGIPAVCFSVLVGLPAAFGQFSGLTTDRHGTKVVLSTQFTPRGETRNDYAKLIEIGQGGGIRVLVSAAPDPEPGKTNVANNLSVFTGPELTADGAGMAWTGNRWCYRHGCGLYAARGSVTTGSSTVEEAGVARVSADGRWAIWSDSISGMYERHTYSWMRRDLKTGTVETGNEHLWGLGGGRVIADDGTVAAGMGDGERALILRPNREPRVVAVPAGNTVTISNDGKTAIAVHADGKSLIGMDTTTGEWWTIVAADEGVSAPVLSDDAGTVLFLSRANWMARNDRGAAQVWTMDLATRQLTQWTEGSVDVTVAALSGDGLVVWAATAENRIIRVVKGQVEQEAVASTPWSVSLPGPTILSVPNHLQTAELEPGSRFDITGAGLRDARLTWQGVQLDPLARTWRTLSFVLPVETNKGEDEAILENPEGPFLGQVLRWRIVENRPRFVYRSEDPVAIFAFGWRADGTELTADNRPLAGETITLKVRGLGAVDRDGAVLLPLTLETAATPSLRLSIGEWQPINEFRAAVDAASPGEHILRFRVPATPEAQWLMVRLSVPSTSLSGTEVYGTAVLAVTP